MRERSNLARIALAAWVNVRPEQLPEEKMWIEHPNDDNRQGWGRVVCAILEEAKRVAVMAAETTKGYPTVQSEAVGEAIDVLMESAR